MRPYAVDNRPREYGLYLGMVYIVMAVRGQLPPMPIDMRVAMRVAMWRVSRLRLPGLCLYGLCSYGLYSYGLYSYGTCMYGLYRYDLYR